jgi:hypothetical protein
MIDIEEVVMELLRQQIPELQPTGTILHVANRMPVQMRASLPFVGVWKIAGTSTKLEITPQVDIVTFAATNHASKMLAAQIEDLMIVGAPHPVHYGTEQFAYIDSVEVHLSPARVEWADETIPRYYASYTTRLRR